MQRQAQGVLIGVTGFVLAFVQLIHAVTGTETIIGLLFNALPFVLMALTISYVGYWLVHDAEFGEYTTQVAVWTAGSVIAFAAVSSLILFSANLAVAGFPVFGAAQHIVTDTITAGALAGALVGIYDAKSKTRLADLQHQRDRMETLANRSADLNNYGRALNQCDTLDEVSSLCVEALATLVGIHDTAVVELRGEFASLVDNTIVGLDDQTIADLANRATDADPATVVSHTSYLPESLPDETESVYTILVTETQNATIVIVALNQGDASVADETTALLEMLVSHAATALENIYKTSVGDRAEAADIEIEGAKE